MYLQNDLYFAAEIAVHYEEIEREEGRKKRVRFSAEKKKPYCSEKGALRRRGLL